MPPYILPSPREVDKAALLINHKITQTPVKTSLHLSKISTINARNCGSTCNIKLFLKCENLQKTGSFKFRGASHFLAKLQDHELKKGVVASSTGTSRITFAYLLLTSDPGNHAQAVAHAAQIASRERKMPISTYVVVPSNCPPKKINLAKSHNATVFLSGTAPNDRVFLASQIQQSTGAILVPSADHADIVLGQATAIREFLHQVGDQGHSLDAVVVPSGGGGLLVGAIAVCKAQGVAVFGAEPETGGPGLACALRTGQRCLELDGSPTIADGLRSLTGEANWEHIRQGGNVDGVFTVGEEQIKEAVRVAVEELGFVIEPSAAVALAAVLFSPVFARRMARFGAEARVGVVLTGGNVGVDELLRLVPGLDVRNVPRE
jgi:threonine dehydratase